MENCKLIHNLNSQKYYEVPIFIDFEEHGQEFTCPVCGKRIYVEIFPKLPLVQALFCALKTLGWAGGFFLFAALPLSLLPFTFKLVTEAGKFFGGVCFVGMIVLFVYLCGKFFQTFSVFISLIEWAAEGFNSAKELGDCTHSIKAMNTQWAGWDEKHGCCLHRTTYYSKTAKQEHFVCAGYGGNLDMMEKLLKADLDINCRNRIGTTALIMAALHYDKDTVKFLLEKGADVNMSDYDGYTALMAACSLKNLFRQDIVEVLLEAGAQVEIENSQGHNALDFAAVAGKKDTIQLLVSKIIPEEARQALKRITTVDFLLSEKNLATHLVSKIKSSGADRILIVGGYHDLCEELVGKLQSTGKLGYKVLWNKDTRLQWLCEKIVEIRKQDDRAILITNFPRRISPPAAYYLENGTIPKKVVMADSTLNLCQASQKKRLAVYFVGLHALSYCQNVYRSQAVDNQVQITLEMISSYGDKAITTTEFKKLDACRTSEEQQKMLWGIAMQLEDVSNTSPAAYYGGFLW